MPKPQPGQQPSLRHDERRAYRARGPVVRIIPPQHRGRAVQAAVGPARSGGGGADLPDRVVIRGPTVPAEFESFGHGFERDQVQRGHPALRGPELVAGDQRVGSCLRGADVLQDQGSVGGARNGVGSIIPLIRRARCPQGQPLERGAVEQEGNLILGFLDKDRLGSAAIALAHAAPRIERSNLVGAQRAVVDRGLVHQTAKKLGVAASPQVKRRPGVGGRPRERRGLGHQLVVLVEPQILAFLQRRHQVVPLVGEQLAGGHGGADVSVHAPDSALGNAGRAHQQPVLPASWVPLAQHRAPILPRGRIPLGHHRQQHPNLDGHLSAGGRMRAQGRGVGHSHVGAGSVEPKGAPRHSFREGHAVPNLA